ncbi:MAG TPA: phenylalanine--tRNA ligase subunit beta [Gemmatimonadaceae bacterium]|nr:phenylalanine--tRNA ligase subunit beta [Gemmatimonadaceae bacterium]
MNASYEWLRAFVPFKLTPTELRDVLTSRCATVDELIAVREDLKDIVVARVVEAARHPNSDHLWVTKVDAGTGALIDVVCGAPNVAVDTLYPFAAVGSVLPGGVKIEKRKIRGETSEGMLCSAKELGLGQDHEGIMALKVDAAPGVKFVDAMPVGDTRLVVDVLPNRPDLLSHEGLAREIAAATGGVVSRPDIADDKSVVIRTHTVKATSGKVGEVNVRLEDPDGCLRYAGAVITGVKVGPSPDWLARRLESVGSRPINNVVDATNYMLLGFGQPMHAFDLQKLARNTVVVRKTRGEELIKTLDGVDRTLPPGAVVIGDAERAQAIAGIIGGSGSEVSEGTTDIFLEVAAFNPSRIRAARRTLGISTDASYRFERGVDAEAIPGLVDYAVRLILSVAGGNPQGSPIDLYPLPKRPQPISLKLARVSRLLGEPVDAIEVERNLRLVGFRIAPEAKDVLKVSPPSWRHDVRGDVDLAEEIARLRGYDTFSSELRPFRTSAVPDAPLVAVIKRVQDALVGEGLNEVRPLPFVPAGKGATVKITNPLAEDEAFLRGDLLTTLVGRAEHNLSRMQGNVRLFEIGTAFFKAPAATSPTAVGAASKPSDAESVELPREEMRVAALVMGQRTPTHFTKPNAESYDEWDIKYLAEAVASVAFPGLDVKLLPGSGPVLWNVVVAGTSVGAARRLKLDAPVWARPAFGLEINLEAVGQSAARPRRYRPIPATPRAQVDLALVAATSVTAAQIEAVIRREAGELLETLTLFDEFVGQGIPEGSRSLAWALTFRDPERTLKDKEVQGRTEKIVQALQGELGVRQRTS